MCIIYTLKRITQPLKIYHYCYFKLREFYTPAKGDPAPAHRAPSPFEYFGFVFCKLDCITCIYIHGKCILLATLTKEKHFNEYQNNAQDPKNSTAHIIYEIPGSANAPGSGSKCSDALNMEKTSLI